LFSVTNLTFIKGRGDIGRLVSTRLVTHYGHIVQDLNRTMLGYELINQLNRATEDEPEVDYFHLLEAAFVALNDPVVPLDLITLWFTAQLLRLSGHTPNLQTAAGGERLSAEQTYEYSFDDAAFVARVGAPYGADDIKFLRLVFSGNAPQVLAKVAGAERLTAASKQLVSLLSQQYSH
jgi:recombinational DNA repair protein (RecF pathway)